MLPVEVTTSTTILTMLLLFATAGMLRLGTRNSRVTQNCAFIIGEFAGEKVIERLTALCGICSKLRSYLECFRVLNSSTAKDQLY